MEKSKYEFIDEIEDIISKCEKVGDIATGSKEAFLAKVDAECAKMENFRLVFDYAKRFNRRDIALFKNIHKNIYKMRDEKNYIATLRDVYNHFVNAENSYEQTGIADIREIYKSTGYSILSLFSKFAVFPVETLTHEDAMIIAELCGEYAKVKKITANREDFKITSTDKCDMLGMAININRDVLAELGDYEVNLHMLEKGEEYFEDIYRYFECGRSNAARIAKIAEPEQIYDVVSRFDYLPASKYDEKVREKGSAKLNLKYSELKGAYKLANYNAIILWKKEDADFEEVFAEAKKRMIEDMANKNDWMGEYPEMVYADYGIVTPWAARKAQKKEAETLKGQTDKEAKAFLNRI